MSPAKRSRKNTKKKRSFVEQLEPGESRELLQRLLDAHPELRKEAERMARGLLGEAAFDSIAEEVQYDVESVSLEDLNSRAGRHEWGYTEPTEAAWELLQEAVDPYLDDMQRYIDLKLEKEALEICKGIILGLYRIRANESGEVLGWAPDFPAEHAGWVLERWTRGTDKPGRAALDKNRRRPRFPRRFVDNHVPEWDNLINTVLSRV